MLLLLVSIYQHLLEECRPCRGRRRCFVALHGIFLYELDMLLVAFGIIHKHVGGETPDLDICHLESIIFAQGSWISICPAWTGGSRKEIPLEENSKPITAVTHHTASNCNFVVCKELTQIIFPRPRIDVNDAIAYIHSITFFIDSCC